MFTGLIEEMGSIAASGPEGDGFAMTINANTVLDGVQLGDSIAVNGVCLTVTSFTASSFCVGLAPETLQRTNLGDLAIGAPVNLERSCTPTTRMGGHFVQGHIDDVGVIERTRRDGDALWLYIKTPPALMPYIATKGFIAIDGTSLTVVDVEDDWFSVTLIAYTQQKIIQASKQPGDKVNLEVDIVAKYVERLLTAQHAPSATPSISRDTLLKHGFIKEGAS